MEGNTEITLPPWKQPAEITLPPHAQETTGGDHAASLETTGGDHAASTPPLSIRTTSINLPHTPHSQGKRTVIFRSQQTGKQQSLSERSSADGKSCKIRQPTTLTVNHDDRLTTFKRHHQCQHELHIRRPTVSGCGVQQGVLFRES